MLSDRFSIIWILLILNSFLHFFASVALLFDHTLGCSQTVCCFLWNKISKITCVLILFVHIFSFSCLQLWLWRYYPSNFYLLCIKKGNFYYYLSCEISFLMEELLPQSFQTQMLLQTCSYFFYFLYSWLWYHNDEFYTK